MITKLEDQVNETKKHVVDLNKKEKEQIMISIKDPKKQDMWCLDVSFNHVSRNFEEMNRAMLRHFLG